MGLFLVGLQHLVMLNLLVEHVPFQISFLKTLRREMLVVDLSGKVLAPFIDSGFGVDLAGFKFLFF